MIFRQLTHDDLGCASYLIGHEDAGVAVVCGSGQRAAVGASLLQRYGARHVIQVVEGGVPLWQRQGWLVDAPGTPGT